MELYKVYLRLLLVYPLIIVLAYFGLRFFLHRFAPAFGLGRRVQVLERTALNNRTFLFVVKVDEDYLLIGVSAYTIALLKELGPDWGKDFYDNKEGEPPAGEGRLPSFTALLQRLRDGKGAQK